MIWLSESRNVKGAGFGEERFRFRFRPSTQSCSASVIAGERPKADASHDAVQLQGEGKRGGGASSRPNHKCSFLLGFFFQSELQSLAGRKEKEGVYG